MGRMGDIDQEDTPPNVVIDEFRSDSPAIKISEDQKKIDDKDTNVAVQTVPCSKCNRNFILERIQAHEKVCNNTKDRGVYDIVQMRVKGTESEKLVKAGKLKLDPAKNGPSKAELTKKISQSLTKEPLPPIKGKENDDKNNDKNNKGAKTNKNTGQAFTVVFDEHSDKLKMKKYSKYHGIPKRDTSSTLIDDRYLSAERARNNWLTAATKISPGINHLDDDEVDHLAASISSQKTICSDAFDFIFDSSNLNPENLKEVEKEDEDNMKNNNNNKVNSSGCCVIS